MNPVVTALERQISEAHAALEAFRADCPHPRNQWVKREEYSNSGDWDYPGTGLIVTANYHCGECGKWFQTTRRSWSAPEEVSE